MKKPNPNQFRFNIDNIYQFIDGEKFKAIGTYPKNDEFVHDMKRIYRKYGYIIKVRPDTTNSNMIKLYWKKKNP